MIKIKYDNRSYNFSSSITPLDFLKRLKTKPSDIYVAKFQNKYQALTVPINQNGTLSFHGLEDPQGIEVYRRSLAFVLARAIFELQRNSRLVIHHSMSNAFYYDFYADVPVSDETLIPIEKRMSQIIANNEPISYKVFKKEVAIDFFTKRAYSDKVRLLKYLENSKEVGIYSCGKFHDLDYGPLAPSTGYLKAFQLRHYGPGFLLCFPQRRNPNKVSEIHSQPKLFQIYQESKRWGDVLKANNVGRFNEAITNGKAMELIQTAESLHEKKIAEIADLIWKRRDEVKLITIAGPSSSGKTTFSKRLCTHLKVNGLNPVVMSLDDYFIDRDSMPKMPNGNYRLDDINAIDLTLLNKNLLDLMRGNEVDQPIFDFEKGKRKKETKKMMLFQDQLLIIEGIHGLNEALTYKISHDIKYKIYVSALTRLNIDDHNRIPTADTRLIRRIIRDHFFRGYSSQQTIKQWPDVVRAAGKNIFAFQEEADAIFNSALIYEPAVLKSFVVPLLEDIPPIYPEYAEAKRLLKFINLFRDIPADQVPLNSILREFIGGLSC